MLSTILDKINGTTGPPLPPISMKAKWRVLLFARLHYYLEGGGEGVNCSILFCPRLQSWHLDDSSPSFQWCMPKWHVLLFACLHNCLRGEGGWLFHFILSTINGASGHPSPSFQWSKNGAFCSSCVFIIALKGGGRGLIEDTININSGELHLIMSKIALLLMLSSDTRWIAAELCVSHKDIFASFIDQTSDYCTSRRIKQDCKYYSLHWKFLLYSFSIMHTLSWEMLVQ